MLQKIFVSFSFLCVFASGFSQTLEVNISNVESNKGQLIVTLYNSEDDFLKKPLKEVRIAITNGKAFVKFSPLSAGQYALAVCHDENNDGDMDTNFIGMPTEPVAMSNGAKGKYGPPAWGDSEFTVGYGTTVHTISFESD